MARGEVVLGRQQAGLVNGTQGRTMLSNHSSQLPKLVVELAQGCVARVRIPSTPSPSSYCDNEDSEDGPMGRVCTSACSCDTLYSTSSSGGSSIGMCSVNPASIAVDSGFSDEEGGISSGCQSPTSQQQQQQAVTAKINQDPKLLCTPRVLCRSTSDSSNSGCESPVPRAFLHEDDQDNNNSSGESNSGGQFLYSGFTCTSVHDLQILSRTETRLQQCGFYYNGLTMGEAKKKLKGRPVGTFVLRDSSHSGFLYTLSTKTMRGTTSVRIAYNNGHFRLDCDEELSSYMPRFDCILRLIQYYISASKRRSSKCVWIESSGRKDTPVVLSTPLKETISPLKHLARRAVHRVVSNDKLEQLPVTATNLQYLMEYPFHV